MINPALLRPLRYAEPERTVRLYDSGPDRALSFFSASVPTFLDWKGKPERSPAWGRSVPR